MEHRVELKYLAERRGGPKRASTMLVVVGGFICALTLAQRGLSELPVLAVVVLVMAVIGVFVTRRMRNTTDLLAETRYSVSGDGIHVSTAGRSVTIPAGELRGVTLVQSISQRAMAYFEVRTRRGTLSFPPIEDSNTFAAELKAALPSVPLKNRRALFVAFS